MSTNYNKQHTLHKSNFDYFLLITVIILVAYGMIMVFSSSYYMAQSSKNYDFDGLGLFKKQLVGAVIGIAGLLVFSFIDYKKLIKLKYFFLAVAIVFLIIVLIPGVGTNLNGSTRWVRVFNISIQPSEIAKFALIIFVASNIYVNRNRMDTFRYGMMPNILMVVVIAVFLILQPNFSAIFLLSSLVFIMMFIGGAKGWQLGAMGAAAAIGGFGIMMLESYRAERIADFTTPWLDASDGGYQVTQSLYGIGAGGFFGSGLGNSKQKLLYLPYGDSDFIFSIICEELGFIGAIFLIALFIFLIYRGIKIASRAPDMFGTMVATGIVAIIALQVIINIAVVTASMPPTGVSLPFISYGNSSLVIFMSMIGILLNIGKQGQKAIMETKQQSGNIQ